MDNKERIKYIQAFPCFAKFTLEQCEELANMMTEVSYKSSDVIVTEDEIIDSIYIIISGELEVTHIATVRNRLLHIPIAILHPGEAVGLIDTGFYSASGKRTATVLAMTEAKLLKLDVKDLYIFLKKNNLELRMYEASQQMLLMRLIKECLPFGKLSNDRLNWLASKVEQVNVPAGEILFREGDPGNKCYLIKSGLVEIISGYEGPVEHQLAVLRPPVIFGEATAITNAARNATARTISDCELLVLRHVYLIELMDSEKSVANTLKMMMMSHSKPIKNAEVTEHQRTAVDNQELVILKNVKNNKCYKLSREGYFIWSQLDGKHSLHDISLNLEKKFGLSSPETVVNLVSKLTKDGFVKKSILSFLSGT